MACISLLILLVRFKNRKATTRCLHRALHFLTPVVGIIHFNSFDSFVPPGFS